MFTGLMQPIRPLTIENTGLLAYVGRILRARGARVYWSRSALVVEAEDSTTANELRRLVQTHNQESDGLARVLVTERDASAFYVTRADS